MPIIQESKSKLARQAARAQRLAAFHHCRKDRGDRYADLGAGVWRWVLWGLCLWCLLATVVVASK